MEPIRVALIGCGSISQRAILPHLAQEDARAVIPLVAVCDVNAPRAQGIAAQFDVPHYHTQLEEVLARDDVDAVLIATPIPLHFEQVMAAVEAGKHVYVQKTMATTRAEADAIIDAAQHKGITIVASPGQMLHPGLQQLRRKIVQKAIGVPYWAIASTAYVGHEYEGFRAEQTVDPAWYYRKGAGPVYDMAVYSLHTLTGLLGPARRVTALSGIRLPQRTWPGGEVTVEVDDNTVLLLDFDGCYAIVGGHFCQTGTVVGWGFTAIYGSAGAVEMTSLEGSTAYPRTMTVLERHSGAEAPFGGELQREEVTMSVAGFIDEAHAALPEAHIWADIYHLAECIAHNRRPLASTEQARHVIEIIEEGYEAARTGQTRQLQTDFTSPLQ